MKLSAILTPNEIAALSPRRLRGVTCVVIDVLRATSTMITALANGAKAILPVGSIEEAVALRRKHRDILLAGERNGLKIKGFDLGNSPREMTARHGGQARHVRGKTLAMTTTNGTVALRACRGADSVYIASLLNLPAMARVLAEIESETLFVCAGTHDRFASEDAVCAGALIARLNAMCPVKLTAAAELALKEYRQYNGNFIVALQSSENGRRLLSIPSLRADVAFCAKVGRHNVLAQFVRGQVIATSADSHKSLLPSFF